LTLELPSSLTSTVFDASGILYGQQGYVTQDMKPFVKSISPNGNAIFDPKLVLERLDVAGKMLREAETPLVYATNKRFENALINFSKATEVPIVRERLLPGLFTNPALRGHIEVDLLFVADPNEGMPTKIDEPFRGDRRAMAEASSVGIPIIAICNSNTRLQDVDLVIPANNTSSKAIATLFYVLAYSYLRDSKAVVPALEAFETVIPEHLLSPKPED
jgi:small subunit ribosomal protein S2